MQQLEPELISVVIPTRFRPGLVQRAIASVLAQTHRPLEIIVVVDGPDAETVDALSGMLNPLLHVLALEANVGLAEARNVGTRQAKGQFVAFLDDDDEWLPNKLAMQLQCARELDGTHLLVSCLFLEKTRTIERVMPLSVPEPGQHFSEYIYCAGGYLQPSTFFVSKALLDQVPFTAGLRYLEDTDWLLRATRLPSTQVSVVSQVLSVYYNLKDGSRESELTPWRVPLEWAKAHHDLFTAKAFPFYVARLCVNARRAKAPAHTFLTLLTVAFRYGRVTPKALAYFLAYWLASDGSLKRLKTKLADKGSRANAIAKPALPSAR